MMAFYDFFPAAPLELGALSRTILDMCTLGDVIIGTSKILANVLDGTIGAQLAGNY